MSRTFPFLNLEDFSVVFGHLSLDAFANELLSISQSAYPTFDRAYLPYTSLIATPQLVVRPGVPPAVPFSPRTSVFARCKGTSDLLSFPLPPRLCVFRFIDVGSASYTPFSSYVGQHSCAPNCRVRSISYTLISTVLTIQT